MIEQVDTELVELRSKYTKEDKSIKRLLEKRKLAVDTLNKRAINQLKKNGIFETIREAVLEKNKKILGICLGFQLMGISSTEDGYNNGLNLIPSEVSHFSFKELKDS